jgi:hypothetical protein
MKLLCLLPLLGLCLAGCATTKHHTIPPGPTLAEVQAMVQAHVSDEVIVTQIQNSGTRYTLTADQIIALHQAGVSATILDAMINTVNKAPLETDTGYYADGYPNYWYWDPWPWPWYWWGWGPYYYCHGGHYYYHGCYYNGAPHAGNASGHGNPPPHVNPPPHGSPPTGGGSHGGPSHTGGSSHSH